MLASFLSYYYHLWRCFTISAKELAINEQIKAKEVRVVDTTTDTMLGVFSLEKAIALAYEKDLDLVCVSPNMDPPVCKIVNYGKFRFEQVKREKEAKKKQKIIEIKEIRIIGLGIDDHDLDTKINHAIRFLKDGCKVKVTIRFRGREQGHSTHGFELMSRIAEKCEEYGTVEKQPKMEGRNMIMFLTSKTGK